MGQLMYSEVAPLSRLNDVCCSLWGIMPGTDTLLVDNLHVRMKRRTKREDTYIHLLVGFSPPPGPR